MMHTVALHQTDEHDREYILCVCGELFVSYMPPDHEWSLVLMSKHLKKVNVEPEVRHVLEHIGQTFPLTPKRVDDTIRGNDDPKPERPEGDDPRSGHILDKPARARSTK